MNFVYFFFSLTLIYIISLYTGNLVQKFIVKKFLIVPKHITNAVIKNTEFLTLYYRRNDLIWVDGFLLDFLQKKSIDIWIRKFVIYSGFLFSERLVFEHVVRVYLINIIWPLHYVGFFEANNTSEVLSILIFFYFFIFSFFFFLFILFM